MQLVFPDQAAPVKVTLNPEHLMTDDEYYDFCVANPDIRFERTDQGEIVIVPPAGGESDHRCLDCGSQLNLWAQRDRRGKAFGSSAEFILPTGAALSPDAAWVSNVRLSQLSKSERRKFMRVSPEFIVEVMSPSDRLSTALEKMQMWIRGGVELAWLIDADEQSVYIYRANREPEKRTAILKLSGEGPIESFELDLAGIWAGL